MEIRPDWDRLLAVDDDGMNRDMLSRRLERQGTQLRLLRVDVKRWKWRGRTPWTLCSWTS